MRAIANFLLGLDTVLAIYLPSQIRYYCVSVMVENVIVIISLPIFSTNSLLSFESTWRCH